MQSTLLNALEVVKYILRGRLASRLLLKAAQVILVVCVDPTATTTPLATFVIVLFSFVTIHLSIAILAIVEPVKIKIKYLHNIYSILLIEIVNLNAIDVLQ